MYASEILIEKFRVIAEMNSRLEEYLTEVQTSSFVSQDLKQKVESEISLLSDFVRVDVGYFTTPVNMVQAIHRLRVTVDQLLKTKIEPVLVSYLKAPSELGILEFIVQEQYEADIVEAAVLTDLKPFWSQLLSFPDGTLNLNIGAAMQSYALNDASKLPTRHYELFRKFRRYFDPRSVFNGLDDTGYDIRYFTGGETVRFASGGAYANGVYTPNGNNLGIVDSNSTLTDCARYTVSSDEDSVSMSIQLTPGQQSAYLITVPMRMGDGVMMVEGFSLTAQNSEPHVLNTYFGVFDVNTGDLTELTGSSVVEMTTDNALAIVIDATGFTLAGDDQYTIQLSFQFCFIADLRTKARIITANREELEDLVTRQSLGAVLTRVPLQISKRLYEETKEVWSLVEIFDQYLIHKQKQQFSLRAILIDYINDVMQLGLPAATVIPRAYLYYPMAWLSTTFQIGGRTPTLDVYEFFFRQVLRRGITAMLSPDFRVYYSRVGFN